MQSSLTRVFPLTLACSARPPVSVSGTGAWSLSSSFSWQLGFNAFTPNRCSPSGLDITGETDLPISPAYSLGLAIPSASAPSLLRHCFDQSVPRGAGISTCCPSTTLFSLALGPALPWADQPSPGILGLPVYPILADMSLLMPAFSLLKGPDTFTDILPPLYYAPLPMDLSIPQLRRHA